VCGRAQLSCAAVIREASIDDAAGAAALFRLVTPEFVTSAAGVRHFMTTSPPAAQRRWWCAEDRTAIVGWVSAGLVVDTSEAGVVWIAVSVHPEHRRRGIGTALSERAEEHAASIGGRRLLAWSRGDDQSVAFARSRGFMQTGKHDILAVDPRDVEPPDPPPDVELLPFTAFEDDPTPIHHVDTISVLDEPGDVTLDELPLERWIENFWSHPLLDRDVSYVAAVDGVPATATFMQTDREGGSGSNNGTGTLPEFRRRGLATLAKRASLARAATLGITRVYTGNDVTNVPMLAINRRLGYAPCSTTYNWAKDVVTSAP
jgi:GNAT superfamily N-acetyltransferase